MKDVPCTSTVAERILLVAMALAKILLASYFAADPIAEIGRENAARHRLAERGDESAYTGEGRSKSTLPRNRRCRV